MASTCPPPVRTSVAIGVFDGLHQGHRALLASALSHRPIHGQAVVCTFNPHPKSILRPELAPKPIVSLKTRLSLLEQMGVDGVFVHPFDAQAAKESASSFVERVLVTGFRAQHVIVGEGFVFGHKRSGTVDTLRELGRTHGFEVHALSPVRDGDTLISSSRVREALAVGDLVRANRWLQAPYNLQGIVVSGDKRGRTLGFPTANLAADVATLLPDGVYAARASLQDGRQMMAAVSIGKHPTFEQAQNTKIEAYLLDAGDIDLYGSTLRLSFCEHLRGEKRFPDAQALVQQMHLDVAQVRACLNG